MSNPSPDVRPREAGASPFRWFPIRSLGPQHRGRIQVHLRALDGDDRYLRFGYPASDAHIDRYVERLDFDRDELFGVFNRRLELVAMAHLAFLGPEGQPPTAAEFGVSVLARGRGRGIGSRLFERAGLHARNRGIDTLIVHALSELPSEWTLTARPVFSTDERRVYRQLREALPHHIVLSKLPLVRFCQPTDPQEVRYWYELLGSIHVTFAICSANGRVLAAIDLDTDRSSSRRACRSSSRCWRPAACATCAARSTTCRRSRTAAAGARRPGPQRAARSRRPR
jgi:GNAT superfamily N-acetyltransferase